MKVKSFFIFYLFLNALTFLVSCSKDDLGTEDSSIHSQNQILVGSKWIHEDWDYSIGDDYIGTHDYSINIYFYSNSEGLIYRGQKDNYSDVGGSSYRAVAHFNFNVSGNKIKIEYITDEISDADFSSFTISGNKILADGIEFQKKSLTSDDYDWLATLHGSTGECFWYHDLQKTLYIVGEGEMADYKSFNATPWSKRAFNALKVDDGVTSIGNNAFAYQSLGEVDLPYSSLVRVGENAFSNSCIPEVRLGDNVKEIGSSAFSGCSYLSNISLPENIEYIGDFAFSECKSASLFHTKKLREIGKYAFMGCKVSSFTDSEVLEKVGAGAFTNLSFSKLTLPNSLKTIEHLAFQGNCTEIHIGTGLVNVTGTPFYPAQTGKLYVNQNTPLSLTQDILVPASGWTLYVPEDCKSAYSQAKYWKNFKNMAEDATLESGKEPNGDNDDSDNDDNNSDGSNDNGTDNLVIPQTYMIDGVPYKKIKVERGGTLPAFYIMQTELPPNSEFQIAGINFGVLNVADNEGVYKSEFREFIRAVREKTGISFRLPTKEEWMFAAKGGLKSQGYTYSGSNNIDDVAWYKGNCDGIHDIATKAPNELGLYDMSGNYAEVCNDTQDLYYIDGAVCGGCWEDVSSDCKSSSWRDIIRTGNIVGTTIKEKNAFDVRIITVRLVFDEPNVN